MTEIAFYHLQTWPLERALPRLLEKTLDAGKRAVVMAGSEARVEALNAALWGYDRDSWLPHGSAVDGSAEQQPIWLTTEDENPNGAEYLFLTDGARSDRIETFERCFDLFDGSDAAAGAAARERWRTYQAGGHDPTYWQQTERGGWERQD